MTDDSGALSGVLLSGRYQLVERIGQGGMAEVYRAEDLILGRVVAVKVLRSQFAADPEFLTRFHQEGRSAARLSHPAIVAVHDVGSSGLAQYIVMDLIEGRDLKALLRERGRIPVPEAIAITAQVLAGLQHAHQRGLIHRDVKPQNILTDVDGNARITDFGIAHAVGGRHLTATSTVIGTALYCSPEQAMGRTVTPASDVYSVGVVLYELLAGRPPFEADSPVAVALQHVNDEPLPLRQLDPAIPANVETVVMHALAKDPSERYPTAAAMRDALLNSLRLSSEATTLFAAAGRSESRPPKGLPAAAAPRARDPRARPRPGVDWLAILLGIGVFALVVGAVPLALRVFGNAPAAPAPTAVLPASPPAVVQPQATPTRVQPTTASTPGAAARPTASARPATVPNVVGLKLDQARRELEKASLLALVAEERASATAEAGSVISQSPAQGSSLQPNSTVSLVVSKGQDKVTVPGVTGQTAADARARLETAGFKSETTDDWSDRVPPGQVSGQKPTSGEMAPRDSVVSLVVSKGPRPPTATPQVVRPPEGNWAWVPDVVGLSETEARRRIELAGLSTAYTNYQTETDVADKAFFRSIAPGSVLSVSPGVGERVQKGSTLKIAVRRP